MRPLTYAIGSFVFSVAALALGRFEDRLPCRSWEGLTAIVLVRACLVLIAFVCALALACSVVYP